MQYLSLSIPGFGQVDSGLPSGVPVGGFKFDDKGNVSGGTGVNAIQAFVILIIVVAALFTLWEIGKGGWDIVQSRGVKEKIHSGRERVFYAIFGLIMIFLSFAFIAIASALFGVDLLPFLKFK